MWSEAFWWTEFKAQAQSNLCTFKTLKITRLITSSHPWPSLKYVYLLLLYCVRTPKRFQLSNDVTLVAVRKHAVAGFTRLGTRRVKANRSMKLGGIMWLGESWLVGGVWLNWGENYNKSPKNPNYQRTNRNSPKVLGKNIFHYKLRMFFLSLVKQLFWRYEVFFI